MYNLQDLLTTVVTVKLTTGHEILTKLIGVDEESNLLTIENPKFVIVIDGGVSLMPFTLTGDSTIVTIPLSSVLTVLTALEGAVTDYNTVIEEINQKKDQLNNQESN